MKDAIMKDNRTFYIYSIKNKINGKEYIGQTNQKPEDRFDQHRRNGLSNSFGGKSAIHFAIKLYGWDSFGISIIAECIGSDAADKMEIDLIESRKSLAPNGYNISKGGSNNHEGARLSNSIQVVIDGVWYQSMGVAARKLGISFKALEVSLRGKDSVSFLVSNKEFASLKEASDFVCSSGASIGGPLKGKQVTINGVVYLSKKQAARSLGLSVPSIDKLLRGEEIQKPTEYCIAGKTYKSRAEARRALGVHDTTLQKMKRDNREKLPCTREVTVLGVTYATLTEAKRVTGFSESKINRLAAGGKEIDRRLIIDGVEYKHKTDAMEKLGLTLRQVNRALAVGTTDAASSVISVRIGDVTYKSVHDAMQSTGMSRDTIYRKCADGEDIEFYRDLTTEDSSDTSNNPKE